MYYSITFAKLEQWDCNHYIVDVTARVIDYLSVLLVTSLLSHSYQCI